MRSFVVLAFLVAGYGIASAQSAPIPIKMGLWEKKMTMDTGTGAPMNINSKSCITLESWQEMIGNINKQREGCTVQSEKNAHGYTMTATCKTPKGGTMVTSAVETIQDSGHIVSQSHTTMTTNGQKRNMESKSTSTYLGADCGKVKPDDPEIEE